MWLTKVRNGNQVAIGKHNVNNVATSQCIGISSMKMKKMSDSVGRNVVVIHAAIP